MAFGVFVGANFVHGVFRAIADDIALLPPYNLATWEGALAGGIPSVWLQQFLGTAGFWPDIGALYWATLYWVPPLVILLVTFRYGLDGFLRLLLLHLVLVLAADAINALAPTRPPWMDTEALRIVAERTDRRVEMDPNPFAALPSLHVAVPFAYALWFRSLEQGDRMRGLWRWLMAWSVGMGWCVVYTGEHYVVDIAAGYALALAVFFVLNRSGLLYARDLPTTEIAERATILPLRPRESRSADTQENAA